MVRAVPTNRYRYDVEANGARPAKAPRGRRRGPVASRFVVVAVNAGSTSASERAPDSTVSASGTGGLDAAIAESAAAAPAGVADDDAIWSRSLRRFRRSRRQSIANEVSGYRSQGTGDRGQGWLSCNLSPVTYNLVA